MAIKKKFVVTYRHGNGWGCGPYVMKRGGKPVYFRTKREGQRWIEEAKANGELKSAVKSTVWEVRKMK